MTSLKKHPDYLEETRRLKSTIQYMDIYIQDIYKKQQSSTDEIKEAMVNLDYLDSSQSYITILVNARYLDYSRESLEKVLRAKAKPYFSRIDFRDNREKQPAKYYIGKLSLFKDDHEPLIIDWRAPIAGVYYDGRLGEVSYEAEEGTVTGELLLKRHHTIEKGQLSDFFDVEITTSDEMLQETLRGSADHRLKDIVATIQAEQNKIIRANLEKPLIVQGVAGSGKTTIALHRIAYLIYTYEKTFKPENFMIIAPNKLFLNYISDVLPELGVEEARQTTFVEFCFDLLNIKSKLTRQEEKLTILMDAQKESQKQRELIEWASFFKGSMTFRKLIDNYLVQIQREMLPQEDVLLDVFPLMTAQEVEDNFLYEYAYLPIYKRLEQIKKKLSFRTRHKKKKFIEAVSDDYEQKIKTARFSAEDEDEARQKAVSLMFKRDEIIARIEKAARNLAASYIKKFKKSDTLSCYIKLITDPDMLQSFSPEVLDSEKVRYLCKASETYLKEKKLESEDLAALLYLKSKLEGFRDKVTCRYVVIDEAQDFSLFQFYVLKHVLDTENFTILGDLSQGIYAYRGVKSWQDVEEQIFSGQATCLTLRQSYRTTIEIMELANQILQQGMGTDMVLAEPVVRHGSEPEVKTYTKTNELAAAAIDKIKALRREGCSSVAIIGKTLQECKKIKKLLEKQGLAGLTLLTGDEDSYQAGVMIVPSYAAKGLEFDGVLIVNLEAKYHKNELDAKLLYVAVTRAMHSLVVYAMKDTIAFTKLEGLSST